jgi:tRNA-Thr(GGU) m(6)t(6)A37 methyltransferase TsaA
MPPNDGSEDAALTDRVRLALVETAVAAYEDAMVRGLCGEGAWEAAVAAMRALDLRQAESAPSLAVIGHVESPLTDPKLAPKQGSEGSPEAWLVFRPSVLEGLRDLEEGDEVIVLTWLDRADRGTLRVHPRDDPSRAPIGVFSTRSADRPNPIGLHRVRIVSIVDGVRFQVRDLEAVHLTPIVDVKPVLRGER